MRLKPESGCCVCPVFPIMTYLLALYWEKEGAGGIAAKWKLNTHKDTKTAPKCPNPFLNILKCHFKVVTTSGLVFGSNLSSHHHPVMKWHIGNLNIYCICALQKKTQFQHFILATGRHILGQQIAESISAFILGIQIKLKSIIDKITFSVSS